jgi:hypothetical protein
VALQTKDGGTRTLFSYGVNKFVTEINYNLDQKVAAVFPLATLEDVKGAADPGHAAGFDNLGTSPHGAGLLASRLYTG